MTDQIVPETKAGVEEEVDRAEELLASILKALENQGGQLEKLVSSLSKAEIRQAAEAIAEEPELVAGDATAAAGAGAETVTGAAAIPPDVIQDVLTDTDKGLKEVKPKSTKKSIFKKRRG